MEKPVMELMGDVLGKSNLYTHTDLQKFLKAKNNAFE